ncbi:MAG: HAD-IA family hydrolase [bacterium]
MIETIIFDLDDTLYDHNQYLQAAFAHAASQFARVIRTTPEQLNQNLQSLLKKRGSSYGRLFDDLLGLYGINNPTLKTEIIEAYRAAPIRALRLYPDAQVVLPQLSRELCLGLLTNGNPVMQRRKVVALKISPYFRFQIFAAELGSQKPDPIIFKQALEIAESRAETCLYIGDNPHVDFTGAKQCGIQTVRLLRGEFSRVNVNNDAIDFIILNYQELLSLLSRLNYRATPLLI